MAVWSAAAGVYRNVDWLSDQYITQQKSAKDIGLKAGVSKYTIYSWLRDLDIPVRSIYETNEARANHVILTDEALEFIEGGLLGDWSVCCRGPSATVQCGSKYREYLEWLSNALTSFGIKQSGEIHRQVTSFGVGFQYHSRFYRELKDIYEKWYPSGKKIVPVGLQLTPLVAREWYIGDGHLYCRRKRSPSIILYTNDFSPKDIDSLVYKLADCGIPAKRRNDHTIYIGTAATPDFLKYIGDCPPGLCGIYSYKWELNRREPLHFYNYATSVA